MKNVKLIIAMNEGNCVIAKLSDRDEVIKILKDCDMYSWSQDLPTDDQTLFSEYKKVSDIDWERLINHFCDDGIFEIKEIKL